MAELSKTLHENKIVGPVSGLKSCVFRVWLPFPIYSNFFPITCSVFNGFPSFPWKIPSTVPPAGPHPSLGSLPHGSICRSSFISEDPSMAPSAGPHPSLGSLPMVPSTSPHPPLGDPFLSIFQVLAASSGMLDATNSCYSFSFNVYPVFIWPLS